MWPGQKTGQAGCRTGAEGKAQGVGGVFAGAGRGSTAPDGCADRGGAGLAEGGVLTSGRETSEPGTNVRT